MAAQYTRKAGHVEAFISIRIHHIEEYHHHQRYRERLAV